MKTNYSLIKIIDKNIINQKVTELASRINNDFSKSDKLLFIGVLKGAWIFLADIVRCVNLPLEISFIAVSSYRNETESAGIVRLLWDVDVPLEGRDVFLVEDIIDTGLTLSHLKKLFTVRNPRSINICCLLDKPSRRMVDLTADYVGFIIPDDFVVGYGLDYQGRFRNLSDLYKVHFKHQEE
jgi:hypoxanthine phosphoribosyltransferase